MKPQNQILWMSAMAMALAFGVSGCKEKAGKAEVKADTTITAKLEAIRQASQPVTLAELNAWYPEPPTWENAAPLYGEAFAALSAEDVKSPSFLAENQQVLSLLHSAAAKSQCRYPVDLTPGAAAQLPHLAKVKTCAQLLGQEATAQAGKGRADLAAQSVMDGLRLSRSLEQEPVLISQLVRIAADAIVLSSLEGALNLRLFPEERLAQLQTALREEEGTLDTLLPRAFAAERCQAIHFFQMPPQDYAKVSKEMGTNCPLGLPVEFERYRHSAAFNADFNLCPDYYSNWLSVASAPFPACLEAAGQWAPEAAAQISEAKDLGYRISAMVLPELNKTMERAADCLGQLRAAQAAIAVERHRLAGKSSLPDALAQLVPNYLPAVPADPYDGKPVRYKKLSAKGHVVYSLGRNRQDDGGTPKPAGGKADGPYDVTFTVRR